MHARCLHRLITSLLLGIAFMLAGCSASGEHTALPAAGAPTATLAPTAARTGTSVSATSTPHAIATFGCTPGDMPVAATSRQITCSSQVVGAFTILVATYTTTLTDPPIDEARLAARGWQLIDQGHGDSPFGAIGGALYFNQSAWLAVHYDNPARTLQIEEGIPADPLAVVQCGKTITAASGQIAGVPLPTDLVLSQGGDYRIALACLADVQRFYEVAMPAAGWSVFQPFRMPDGASAGAPTTVVQATFTHGTTSVSVSLSSGNLMPTAIAIAQLT